MGLFPITIRGEEFKVSVADTDEARSKGLSGYSRIGKNKGMIFMFPQAVQMNMVMRDMNFGLDFLFLDEDWAITDKGSRDQDSTEGIYPSVPVHMVVELPQGTIERLQINLGDTVTPSENATTQLSGVKKFKHGGTFEMIGDKVYQVKIDDIQAELGRLQVLNEHGEVVANIDNGSRIFSREHTAEMIQKFKNGDKLGLAESMIKIIDIQNGQTQEYVTK
tara:strand:+ start:75 stop:734 length:660 start_codon:yes stop_codon:yes gene_type:complete